ncbi:hypothetical protein AOLI_G00265270 [Acnodon oligacanthus]
MACVQLHSFIKEDYTVKERQLLDQRKGTQSSDAPWRGIAYRLKGYPACLVLLEVTAEIWEASSVIRRGNKA